jgi:ATP-dependent Lhr-like helicase
MRGRLPDELLGEAGRLSPEAIAEVRAQIQPDIRDEHELHDLLCSMVVVPAEFAQENGRDTFVERLKRSGRVLLASVDGHEYCVAAEHAEEFRMLFPAAVFASETSIRMTLAG